MAILATDANTGILILPNYIKQADSLNSCCSHWSKLASSRGQLKQVTALKILQNLDKTAKKSSTTDECICSQPSDWSWYQWESKPNVQINSEDISAVRDDLHISLWRALKYGTKYQERSRMSLVQFQGGFSEKLFDGCNIFHDRALKVSWCFSFSQAADNLSLHHRCSLFCGICLSFPDAHVLWKNLLVSNGVKNR